MSENDTPTTPDAPSPAPGAAPGNTAPADPAPAARGSNWRDRLSRGNKSTIAAGALAGVVIAALGFGAGYAVNDGGEPDHGPVSYSQENGYPGGPRGDAGPSGPGQDQDQRGGQSDQGQREPGTGQDQGAPGADQGQREPGTEQDQRGQGGTDGSRPDGDSATPMPNDTAKS